MSNLAQCEPHASQIVATILCGNAGSLIEAAIRSVIDWVDEICLIDTGITDDTLTRAEAITGPKLSVSQFEWCDDFAQARNFALAVAHRAGASWALTVDTDERVEFIGYADRQTLIGELESGPMADSWLVWSRCGSYPKSRFIRVPATLQWEGRTHEALVGDPRAVHCRILKGCRFWEVSKTPPQFRRKLERDLIILLEETTAQPRNPRWWYYLGQTYECLKLYQPAIDAFATCIRLDGWPDESSWACYTAARCSVALKNYRQAEEYCALGLTRKPSVPELPWLAGWCCFQRGAWRDAVTWSQLAVTLAGDMSEGRNAIFRHMPAWYEAAYDVMRYAYHKLGESDLADQAEMEFQARRAERLKAVPEFIDQD